MKHILNFVHLLISTKDKENLENSVLKIVYVSVTNSKHSWSSQSHFNLYLRNNLRTPKLAYSTSHAGFCNKQVIRKLSSSTSYERWGVGDGGEILWQKSIVNLCDISNHRGEVN